MKTYISSLLSDTQLFLSNKLFFLIPKQQQDNVNTIAPQELVAFGRHNQEHPFTHEDRFKQIEPKQPHPFMPFISEFCEQLAVKLLFE